MVQLRAGAFRGELQPKLMQQVEILRPQPGRMRAEVEEDGFFLARRHNSCDNEGRGSGRFSHSRPIAAPCSAGLSFGDSPITMRDDCRRCAVATIAAYGSLPGPTISSTCLPAFSARFTTLVKTAVS